MAAHFLLTTFGSLGDIHPYIAVGLGLRDRGHTVTVASSESYRAKIEGEGLRFHAMRPDVQGLAGNTELMRRAYHPRTGGRYILREVFLPYLEQTYADLLPAARNADVLVSHLLAFATPMAAEILKKPWISVILQPSMLLSAYDPPAVSGAPVLHYFRGFGPGFWRLVWRFAKRVARGWGAPINQLRRKLGLNEVANPILDDMFSPHGNQAWFSKVLARPQPDWPQHLQVTGFPFYDKLEPGQGMTEPLRRFLDDGAPPVVFTLGSSAVFDAGQFYEESLQAVREAGCRAVMLTGGDPRNQPKPPVPAGVFVAEYAPYSELFPLAAAVVHQGGVGTTAQVLKSGRPMIVVPYSHDQPDNAMRVVRLGSGRTIPRGEYRAARAGAELGKLLGTPSYAQAAEGVAAEMALEDGVRSACEGLEAALRR